MGLAFLQATQIYRRCSIMRQDDRTSRQDDRTNQQDDRPSGQDDMTNRQDNSTSRQGDIENRHQVFFTPILLNRHHLFMLITQDHPPKIICTSQNLILKDKLSQFLQKSWNEIPLRDTMYVKKMFKRKLISVLFEVLQDKDDYLDVTMMTQEIKLRNP